MRLLFVFASLLSMTSPALAQATITGFVRSDRGEAVSGVGVEARSSSPVEEPHTTVTDERGYYCLEALRQGSYTLTFSHPGLRPYVQETVDLTTSSVVIVNAEMTVIPVVENVVVTGTVPLLHVMTAAHEAVMTGDDLRSIPT